MFADFFSDETGAASVDWVALVGGVTVLGIAVVYSVYSVGAASAVASVDGTLEVAEGGLCDALEAEDGGVECPSTD